MLKGKKILLGISGSIAAYKSILLVRMLVKAGAEVRVVMTPSAKDFVSPLTLSTLSRHPVLVDLFDEAAWANHVMLGRWADLMLIAPLSCNTLGKMANGLCDNLLLAVYLSATCPVWVAPAMDEDMWHHPTTKKNLLALEGYGNRVLPVGKGELASGLVGDGRMAEPEDILDNIEQFFSSSQEFAGKKVLITAGPTYEPLDPVRFIGNHSSGKMGIALALEMANRGAAVELVLGPGVQHLAHPGINVTRVKTAEEMYDAAVSRFKDSNVAIMAAAVADYTPVTVAEEKIKKQEEGLVIALKKTRDILKSLGELKQPGQLLVGFALETNNEEANAIEKLQKKNADMIVLNSLNDQGAGFGIDTNKVTIFDRSGNSNAYPVKSKSAVARDIVDAILNLNHA
ncbi:bifunctional phosphopantothenoylcysteine decarboxylase/phosphopantothenate--cysteine ligase CoaBC [Flavihumibacter rivuli]|uniref:bifunctional phosphopantothenoylcysteine decarboxylase/phosphopantothenate--cysteine ligase CoaBC n=1 Tax=Flavihumibacter rivuli TaxID=2838156 RepID=UPI001BDF5913|nr:bifunctional phosphopantothenoylcysteine decarboxylase/phosphopantothenate--cysteine ligase CoaBC [Flavihumibacter rivuli]ULQ56663.1 bifunctional phosphopantothenoylcysteine decarboxylase/phosphopantothenate--cysteine ligase CoaBC [Flavihumibacter rivuli]